MENIFAAYFDSDLRTLLQEAPWFVEHCTCLVNCLDSTENTADILLRYLPQEAVLGVGRAALVSGADLLANRGRIFFGFDEIYVFQASQAQKTSFDSLPNIWTSERAHFDQRLPEEFKHEFIKLQAIRYASDGDGLNVACRDATQLQLINSLLTGSR